MSENDNVQKLQQLYAAFGRGDINMILSNVTDDVSWGTDTSADVPWYRIREGRDGVGDFFATLAREVEFPEFTPSRFAGAGDVVYAHIDLTYKFKEKRPRRVVRIGARIHLPRRQDLALPRLRRHGHGQQGVERLTVYFPPCLPKTTSSLVRTRRRLT